MHFDSPKRLYVVLAVGSFLFVPAGLEVARWDSRSRAIVLALQALMLIVLRCKLAFFVV